MADMSEVRAIGTRTNNAQLIADCAELGYLPSPVFDATYGLGRFWKEHRPDQLVTNDLDTALPTDHSYDFRNLPFRDRSFASVVLDPPYKLNGTSIGTGPATSDASYGVAGEYTTVAERHELIYDGLWECQRIAREYVLVKCQDQVVSGKVVWQTHIVAGWGTQDGWTLIDKLHVQGYRQQPPGRRQVHARRDYSTLLVFGR